MVALTLTVLPAAAKTRINLAGLELAKLATGSTAEFSRTRISTDAGAPQLGDLFRITGAGGDTIAIEGDCTHVDGIGAGLSSGTLVVNGNVGSYAGHAMTGGRLEIRGSAADYLGAGLNGGLIHVTGKAGNFAGGQKAGERFGMAGGIILVEASIGERAGDRMRRGTIIARGAIGAAAGSRMVGGTILTELGFGAGPGPMLRRGTLIGPKIESLLATFADCGVHDLNILRVMSRYWAEALGPLAPRPLPLKVRRFAGDLATLGKGELLLTA